MMEGIQDEMAGRTNAAAMAALVAPAACPPHDGESTASNQCCGNRQHCGCDFTHAVDNLGMEDPNNEKGKYCAAASTIAPNRTIEAESLQSIYTETGGNHWFNNSRWMSKSDHCDWYGISCEEGFITKINLTSNNVTGEFPADSLSKLNKTKTMYLADNNLWGTMAVMER